MTDNSTDRHAPPEMVQRPHGDISLSAEFSFGVSVAEGEDWRSALTAAVSEEASFLVANIGLDQLVAERDNERVSVRQDHRGALWVVARPVEPSTSGNDNQMRDDEIPALDALIPGPAPDLSIHFFDHHGSPGDESAKEYHIATVSIPNYFWDDETPLDLARYARRLSDEFLDKIVLGLCFTLAPTDAGIPTHGHGSLPTADAHAAALHRACELLIYKEISKADLAP